MSELRYVYSRSLGKHVAVKVMPPLDGAPARKRRKVAKLTETWAKVPHHRGLALAKQAGDSMLAVLLVLEIAVHEAHSNRVKLTNDLLGRYKITHQAKTRGLRRLADAGVISVEWGGRGRKTAPVVTHHWYAADGTLLDDASAPS